MLVGKYENTFYLGGGGGGGWGMRLFFFNHSFICRFGPKVIKLFSCSIKAEHTRKSVHGTGMPPPIVFTP